MDKETTKEKAHRLEAFQTPVWAIDAILKVEPIDEYVIDPCTGLGALSMALLERGHAVFSIDIEDWGFPFYKKDFLKVDKDFISVGFRDSICTHPRDDNREFDCMMNPPFSYACDFFLKARELGAKKIIMFQRLAWFESEKRRVFFNENPPNKIYLCGNRATCERFDVVIDNLKANSTPIAHAWFVWEEEKSEHTVIERVYRNEL